MKLALIDRLPLSRKVALVALLAAVAAAFIGDAILVSYQFVSERRQLVKERTAIADILAANLAASIVFKDHATAEETLSTALMAPGLRWAAVFDREGQPFATAGAAPPQRLTPMGEPAAVARFRADALEIYAPIKIGPQREGELIVLSRVENIGAVFMRLMMVASGAFLAALALAYVAAARLAAIALRPVQLLTKAMSQIRGGGDFSTRVPLAGQDEVGRLSEEFNSLLDRLQANDKALSQAMGELVRAKEAAEAANVAKTQFLANMSHEIRTPLNGVLGMAQVMSQDELIQRQRERLTALRSSGEILLTVVNDVLDVAKIETGTMTLDAAPVDLTQELRAVFSVFGLMAEDKGLRATLEIDSALEGLWTGDAPRIRQIFGNLLSNAVKFTQAGEIRLSASLEDGVAVVVVRDTGIGLPAEGRGKLFERFSQFDNSSTRRFGGTGLGLAICRELVHLMGGVIDIKDVDGPGACFEVRIPLARCEAPPDEFGPHQGPDGAESLGRPVRVLAAEDNPTNRKVLGALLDPLDLELTVVENGRAAVETFEPGAFDLVLMDVQMPEMDGLEAARRIREIERAAGCARTPIIAVSANVLTHQVQNYLDNGMDGHVGKPIQAPELYAAISAALDHRADDSNAP